MDILLICLSYVRRQYFFTYSAMYVPCIADLFMITTFKVLIISNKPYILELCVCVCVCVCMYVCLCSVLSMCTDNYFSCLLLWKHMTSKSTTVLVMCK
jgi:hypothetical protein